MYLKDIAKLGDMTTNLPAYETKDHPILKYQIASRSFNLLQNDTSHTTGSTLWLSAQILSEYFVSLFPLSSQNQKRKSKRSVLELGAGIGLTSLVLGELGFDVVASDIERICEEYLRPNVDTNASDTAGSIVVEELDWFNSNGVVLDREYDIVCASDVIWETRLVGPLCATVVRAMSNRTVLYIAQEVRVQSLFDTFVVVCEKMGLKGVEVRPAEIKKVMRAKAWEDEAWEGVVIWKFRRRSKRQEALKNA